jgi:two-component system, NarL family, invasion response regulator UvrY
MIAGAWGNAMPFAVTRDAQLTADWEPINLEDPFERDLPSGPGMPLRVLIVHGDVNCVKRLCQLPFDTPQIICAATGLAGARKILEKTDFVDGVLLDPRLPDGNGLELLKELLPRQPSPAIAVVTTAATNAIRLELWQAGVVVLDAPLEAEGWWTFTDLLSARSRSLVGALDKFLRERRYELSRAMVQVLLAGARGLTIDQTAVELRLSPSTVKTYRARIQERTAPSSFQQLVAAFTEFVVSGAAFAPFVGRWGRSLLRDQHITLLGESLYAASCQSDDARSGATSATGGTGAAGATCTDGNECVLGSTACRQSRGLAEWKGCLR